MVRGAGSKLVGASGVIFLHAAHTPHIPDTFGRFSFWQDLHSHTRTRTQHLSHALILIVTADLSSQIWERRSMLVRIHAYTLRCARTQRLAQLSWFEAPPRLFGFSPSVNLGQ